MSEKLGFAENFALSGAAAVIAETASAPIERIKLLIQNQDEMIKAGRLSEPYKGVIDCAVRTFRDEGLLSFWRSNFTNCLRYLPTQGLNFAFKDVIKDMFRTEPDETYIWQFSKNVISGGIGGTLSLCVVYSLDYARTRLASDVKTAGKGSSEWQFNGLTDVYVKTVTSAGFVGLYRGFLVSAFGIFVYRGLYFGLYDFLKPIMFDEHPSFFVSFVLGYGVTVAAGTMSYPLDTIRRRMMMTPSYKGTVDCVVQIINNEGFMSTMKGAGANILRGCAGAGVLAGFDKFKELYVAWRLKTSTS
ncbi:hypothetical protein BaRGS_00035852 [Batillaria attramentaria]|uniref:ADP/ATP translocase n=1 Tax=Batillaria attramentaria TaxID=370345 RepID=A0ABD0JDF6_9CAEN|nr:hypothetical protein BaRGS_031357 [Batillaria attramentaria]